MYKKATGEESKNWKKGRKLIKNKETNSVAWVRKRTIPTEKRRLSAKLVLTFSDRGSAADPLRP
jgi:hypothetical protein